MEGALLTKSWEICVDSHVVWERGMGNIVSCCLAVLASLFHAEYHRTLAQCRKLFLIVWRNSITLRFVVYLCPILPQPSYPFAHLSSLFAGGTTISALGQTSMKRIGLLRLTQGFLSIQQILTTSQRMLLDCSLCSPIFFATRASVQVYIECLQSSKTLCEVFSCTLPLLFLLASKKYLNKSHCAISG